MVLDTLANAERSYSLHPGFKPAFEYLKTVDFETVGSGRHEIDGSRLFMIVVVVWQMPHISSLAAEPVMAWHSVQAECVSTSGAPFLWLG